MMTKEEMEQAQLSSAQLSSTTTIFADGSKLIREHVNLIGSTQDRAKEKAVELTDENWLLFTADEQTKGRGTHGRRWASPPDVNIYGTFVFRLPKEKERLLLNIPQITTYSVLLTLEHFGFEPRLRWVNDVLLNKKKMCGVLCETAIGSDLNYTPVLLGIGLNVNMPEEICANLDQPVTSLMVERGQPFDKDEVLGVLQQHLKTNIDLLIKHGFSLFVNDISQKMEFIGESIKVKEDINNTITEGIMQGIDENGFLLIQTAAGLQTLCVGHIMNEAELRQHEEELKQTAEASKPSFRML
jgi:BirA family biotin operon repressor/biotin-[acetyl-CoA-carboxylase] ligase